MSNGAIEITDETHTHIEDIEALRKPVVTLADHMWMAVFTNEYNRLRKDDPERCNPTVAVWFAVEAADEAMSEPMLQRRAKARLRST